MLSVFFLSFFFFLSIHGDNNAKEEDIIEKCVSSCPRGWERIAGRCYLWSYTPKTWADAEKFCKSKGGHLASVTNEDIHKYIWSKTLTTWRDKWGYERTSRRSFWVGGTDQEEESRWLWSDGSAWNFTKWASWPYQQPNSFYPTEDCLLIYDEWAQNGWNDRHCDVWLDFVCSQSICTDTDQDAKTVTTTQLAPPLGATNNNKFPVLAVALPIGIIVMCTVLVLVVYACCKYKKKGEEGKMNTDENPVYGISTWGCIRKTI